MATSANSALSFQGLSTGIQTDALVSAILAQEGQGLAALQARQTRNNNKTTALTAMQTSMTSLFVSLAALQDKFNARTVTSTDTNNSYVTATASGAGAGTYDVKVSTLATKGRISPTLDASGNPTNLAVANPANAIFTAGQTTGTFAVQGTDGVIKTFQVTNNSLNGLRDAINASGAGVTASIVNTGTGTTPYQLVITANATGTGQTGGNITLADITNGTSSSAGASVNTLGITAGFVDSTTAPTTITGLSSATSGATAQNAVFTLNGIQLTRQSNVVSDAADGITFTLKQGGQTGSTTLTVSQDISTATAGIQDVITKFNALVSGYKSASATTKNSDGSLNQGPLAGDSTSRSIMAQIRTALTGASAGLPSTAPFTVPASLGVRTNSDGTLSLDTTTFKAAMEKDPSAALRLFTFSGDTTNGVVSFKSGGAKTATGPVTFNIDQFTTGGTVSGTFSGTYNGTAFSNVRLTGSNGTLVGAAGTPLEGLTLSVTATGTGTLTLARGAGQAVSDLITSFSASGTGFLSSALNNIRTQNQTLATQISAAQSALNRRKQVLQLQFSTMESTVAQMRASASSLTGA
ncbi:hypothetical protein GETHLI_16830 [Geothrix limicola]|uniref:Flagellar hook-associated protein 2 n=1 Tax=Geothrix limicola TaxID=2927978 RepID=A0ABQ5QFS9_9BACT|nr:flagellar filament capping protein FliD [Geothrix limicola]GLH73181.1 hypothetical protein GETHLI_16830 [Geothrix limicola]